MTEVTIDITRLKASWTKYDIVKLIDIVADNDLSSCINGTRGINAAVLKAFLGVINLSDELPSFWLEIQKHPKHSRLFALVAAITSHYKILKLMSGFAKRGGMSGTYSYKHGDKMSTNLRSALVVSGASLQNYRRESEVPYTFVKLFECGDVGLLAKDLFINRLVKIGYDEQIISSNPSKFYEACDKALIIDALALSRSSFEKWINGMSLDIENEVFSIKKLKVYSELPMLRVNQWMNEWDDIDFNVEELRRKPKPHFYTFSIDARLLKRLSDVHRRNTDRTSVQRKKSDARIREISDYIEGGFPWSTLSDDQKKSAEHSKLKMPGILPTAIIINILSPGSKRNGKEIKEVDCLKIKDELNDPEVWEHNKKNKFPTLIIPEHLFEDDWDAELKPIEVIDGQHRLWAFDENQNFNGNYELPVIAFDNLDRAWQAYMFYTVNIKPVRINTSLGFDLYPMLRTQHWLENSKDGVLAYRESRAQELVEALWLYPQSPWHNRINMLGEQGGPIMSQAAFVRTLISSFFRQTRGLFSSDIGKRERQVLNWNRAQQAAFLILIWDTIKIELLEYKDLQWAEELRKESDGNSSDDPAFTGKNTFLSRDQGVRPIMSFANDFFYSMMDESILNLNEFVWDVELNDRLITNESIDHALDIFKSNRKLNNYVQLFAQYTIEVDWRTSNAFFETDAERKKRLIYKGSGGYSEFYNELKNVFLTSTDEIVKLIMSII